MPIRFSFAQRFPDAGISWRTISYWMLTANRPSRDCRVRKTLSTMGSSVISLVIDRMSNTVSQKQKQIINIEISIRNHPQIRTIQCLLLHVFFDEAFQLHTDQRITVSFYYFRYSKTPNKPRPDPTHRRSASQGTQQ